MPLIWGWFSTVCLLFGCHALFSQAPQAHLRRPLVVEAWSLLWPWAVLPTTASVPRALESSPAFQLWFILRNSGIAQDALQFKLHNSHGFWAMLRARLFSNGYSWGLLFLPVFSISQKSLSFDFWPFALVFQIPEISPTESYQRQTLPQKPLRVGDSLEVHLVPLGDIF